jgi:hypothetical protein
VRIRIGYETDQKRSIRYTEEGGPGRSITLSGKDQDRDCGKKTRDGLTNKVTFVTDHVFPPW